MICQDEDANIDSSCGYVVIYSFIRPYLDVHFFSHLKVIWRYVEDVLICLWRARKSALCVVQVLLLTHFLNIECGVNITII